MLTSGAAWVVYRLVDYLHEEPALVITDPTLMPGTTVSLGIGAPGTVAAMRGTSAIEGVLPVAGTAALEQVKSEGAGAASDDPGFATQVIGQVRVFRLQMSQAEVSGALVVTSDLSVRADGRTDVHSSWVLTNDVGSWECDSGSGYIPRDGTEEFGFGTAAGTGEYEGQTLCLQWHIKRGGASAVGSGSTGSTPVSGWIQPAEKEAGSVVDGRTPFVAAVAGGFEGGVCRTDTSDPLQTFNRRGHFEVETSDHRVAGEVEAKVDRSIYPNPGASLEVREVDPCQQRGSLDLRHVHRCVRRRELLRLHRSLRCGGLRRPEAVWAVPFCGGLGLDPFRCGSPRVHHVGLDRGGACPEGLSRQVPEQRERLWRRVRLRPSRGPRKKLESGRTRTSRVSPPAI